MDNQGKRENFTSYYNPIDYTSLKNDHREHFRLFFFTSLSCCFFSMVVKGYKKPLVQKDMWELNEADSAVHISQRFQSIMESELCAARARFQTWQRKTQDKNRQMVQLEASQNRLSEGLQKGVSQDVLMMVRVQSETHVT